MTSLRRGRRGTVLPLIACCLIGLFAFVALAVDLGMLAVSRTQCQNAADIAALIGARTLNNKDGVSDNNRPAAIAAAKDAPLKNFHLSTLFASAQVTNVQAGMYVYNAAANPPTFEVNFTSTPGTGQSWTAMRVMINIDWPTYFMRVFGVSTMPTGATAIAVHRPRDVAFALDMTTSMSYSSQFNTNSVSTPARSLNADTLVPTFAHYSDPTIASNIVASDNLSKSDTKEAFPRNNYTMATPAGPPIVRNFWFDKSNISNPATLVSSVATKTVNGKIVPDLLNAFHRWTPKADGSPNPPESNGDSANYVPPTYDFTGYDVNHKGDEADAKGPLPAPDTFKTMTDSTDGKIVYAGDRYRRWFATGTPTYDATTKQDTNYPSLNKSEKTWTGNYRAARTVAEFLKSSSYDPVWEKYGYDLDVDKYRWWKQTYNNGNPAPVREYLRHVDGGNDPTATDAGSAAGEANILLPAADTTATPPTAGDRFQGYSMGPGYWGKTFFMWPPDPRAAKDWRKRFFTNFSSNSSFFNSSGGGQVLSSYTINYTAVLAWIKSGPMVLPPNLRAGHVLYYSSIPDNVSSAGQSSEAGRDQQFWKKYIDYVIAGATSNLYGAADTWGSSSFTAPSSGSATFNSYTVTGTPTMSYSDSLATRPRLHFWFGPLSMMDFMGSVGNWLPGTSYEAHNWQLKAGMSAVIDDVRNNHPNDNVGMTFFAANFTNPRVPIGQDYVTLKNALFHPLPLLSTLAVPNPTVTSVRAEYRPYNDNFSAKPSTDMPNAQGTTDPNTGLAIAYNLLSPSKLHDTSNTYYGSARGRRGAAKLVILETDGVPNTYRACGFQANGYNSYYTIGGSSGLVGNNNNTVLNNTYPIVQQIVKQASLTTSGDSGLSLPNTLAKVYPIGFGDLFDPTIAPGATTARDQASAFLAQVAAYGGTGPSGVTTLSSDFIITGTYDHRIETLRACMERIFQSGVSVTLIE